MWLKFSISNINVNNLDQKFMCIIIITFPGCILILTLFVSGIPCIPAFPFDSPTQSDTYTYMCMYG